MTAKVFGFLRDMSPRGNATSSTYPPPEYNITVATSNVAQANIADTITFTFDTNLPNKIVYWAVSNTSVSADFVDGITNGNFLLDSNGNATFSKTINTLSLDNINNNFNFLFSHNDPLNSDTFFVKEANVNTIHTITPNITKLSGNGAGKVIDTPSTYENPEQFTLLRFTAGRDNDPNQYGISSDPIPSNYTLSFNTFNNTNFSIDYLLVGAGGVRGGQNLGTSAPAGQFQWGTGGGAGGEVTDGITSLSNATVYNLTVSNARNFTLSNSTGISNQIPESATNNTSAFGFSASSSGFGGSFYQYVFPANPQFTTLSPEVDRGGGGHANNGVGQFKTYTSGTFRGGRGILRLAIPGVPDIVAGGGGAGAGGNGANATISGNTAFPGNAGIGYVSNVTGRAVAFGTGGVGVGGTDGVSGTRTGSIPLAPGATVNGLNGRGDAYSGVIYVKYKPYQKTISI